MERLLPYQSAHHQAEVGPQLGERREEIVEARWEWIDFQNNTINVYPTDTFTPKTCGPVELHSTLKRILLAHFHTGRAPFIIKPTNRAQAETLRYNPRRTFTTASRNAGIEGATVKTLRYTFASQLVINGASLYYVQKQMRHSDPTTTMIYAHLAPGSKEIERIPTLES